MNMVTLADGTRVPSDSEAWRHDCEARYIARKPTRAERNDYLDDVRKRRGAEAAEALEATVRAVWDDVRKTKEPA